MYRFCVFVAYLLICFNGYSQAGYPVYPFVSPMKIPLFLSGNFGEIRQTHFHSGIDIKTQGRVGDPVYAVADGYVSRVSVSPSGYGLFLMITHPDLSVSSVYGHLYRFSPRIALLVREQQYKDEDFRVDFELAPNRLVVKKGECVAYAGNSGASGGPHLHFELRDDSGCLIDPLPSFVHMIKDNRAPQIQGIALYPYRGWVNGKTDKCMLGVTSQRNGNVHRFTGWGKVFAAVKTIDCMDGTTNRYGVSQVKLYVDDKLVFSSVMNRYLYNNSRYSNSMIDYEERVRSRNVYLRSMVAPGNLAPIYAGTKNNGIIEIDKERDYNCRYELSDVHGNVTKLPFVIRGVKSAGVPRSLPMKYRVAYDKQTCVQLQNAELIIPEGALYDDIDFVYSKLSDNGYYSDVYCIQNETIPVHKNMTLRIRVKNDTLRDKRNYYLVRIQRGSKRAYDMQYDKGECVALIREFGNYAVACDRVPPSIVAVAPEKWGRTGVIQVRVSDKESGLQSFRGEIDGRFAIFESDVKLSVSSCKIDPRRVKRGTKHTLSVKAYDRCGNETEFKYIFTW